MSIGSSSLKTLTSPTPPLPRLNYREQKADKNHPGYKYHKSNYKLLMILSMSNYHFFSDLNTECVTLDEVGSKI